jgi:hypothetical protein
VRPAIGGGSPGQTPVAVLAGSQNSGFGLPQSRLKVFRVRIGVIDEYYYTIETPKC